MRAEGGRFSGFLSFVINLRHTLVPLCFPLMGFAHFGCFFLVPSCFQYFEHCHVKFIRAKKKAQLRTGAIESNEIDPDSIRGTEIGSPLKVGEGDWLGWGLWWVVSLLSEQGHILTLSPLTALQGFKFITHAFVWHAASAAQPGPALIKLLVSL